MSTNLEEQLLKAIAGIGGGAKPRASLMQGLNLAGQQYFQPSTNIPSTFGDFYVGSPTAVMSNFVPLPLDWMEEDLASKQAAVNQAEQLIAQTPQLGAFAAAPFRDKVKEDIINEYKFRQLPEEWSKKIMANPLAAKKISQEYANLQSRLTADPRLSKLAEEFKKFSEMKDEAFKTGYSNVWNEATQSYVQIPIEQAPIYVADEAEEYIKKYYTPNLAATVTEVATQKGMINPVVDSAGNLQYYNPGTRKTESVSLWDKNNPYTPLAVKLLSEKLMTDPNEQRRYILAEKRGLGDDPQKYYNYMLQTLFPQMYQKNTIEGDDLTIKDPPAVNTEGGGGGTTLPAGVNIVTQELGGFDATGMSLDLLTEGLKTATTNAQAANSAFSAYMQEILNTSPELRQELNIAFSGDNVTPGALYEFQKSLIEKNPKMASQLQSMDTAQMLQIYFGNTKENLTKRYNLTEKEYKKANDLIVGTLFNYASSGTSAEHQAFANNLFEKLSQKTAAEQEYNDHKNIVEAINSQLYKDTPEFKKYQEENPESSTVFKTMLMPYKYEDVIEAITKSTSGVRSFVASEDAKAVQKKLIQSGDLSLDEDGNPVITTSQLKDFYNAFKTTKAKKTATADIKSNRVKIDVIGSDAERSKLTTHNITRDLGEPSDDEILTNLIQSSGGDGKSPYSNMDLLSIVKTLNPKFGSEIKKRTRQLIFNETTGGVKQGIVLEDEKGKTILVESNIPGGSDIAYKIGIELLSDPDNKERALGAQVLAKSFTSQADGSKIHYFFNPNIKLSPGLSIDVKLGNMPYRLKTVKNSDGTISRDMVKLQNGQEIPMIYRGVDRNGKSISYNNIDNAMTAFQILGFDVAAAAGINIDGGSGGSSSGLGKQIK
jgi:hypothetical protein